MLLEIPWKLYESGMESFQTKGNLWKNHANSSTTQEIPVTSSEFSRIQSFYLFLNNFEIWGSFNNSSFKGLLDRRQEAILSLNHLIATLVFEIREFKSKHVNYGSYVNEVLANIIRIIIFFDLVKTILLKKKDYNSIDSSDKQLPNYSSTISKRSHKDK